ncbi:MAG: hypothetical protein FVV1_gp3 [Fushun virga-like virus 1]|nr:MAG: hypothetical protein FVV1_gp3 [Fushun virga-like virus 1]
MWCVTKRRWKVTRSNMEKVIIEELLLYDPIEQRDELLCYLRENRNKFSKIKFTSVYRSVLNRDLHLYVASLEAEVPEEVYGNSQKFVPYQGEYNRDHHELQ